MKVTGALLLTLSAVTPAASVYVVIPGIIQQAGAGAFHSLAFAAVVGLAMAFVYAELGAAHPIAGGEYALIGRTLGPQVGFVFMGMSAIGGALAPAVLALGASTYLKVVWPDAGGLPVALAIIGAATVFGVLNIRTNAVVTGAFLMIEILVLVLLAWLGFAHPNRDLVDVALHPMTLSSGRILTPTPLAAIGLATAVAIFAYNGFGVSIYFSEEMVGAPRRVARTVLLGLGLTVALEFIPTAAVLVGAPDLGRLIASTAPFGDFVSERGGAGLGVAVSLGVALAIVNAMIAILLVNARFFYSSGRDRAWPEPVNRALTRLNHFGAPWVATLVAGGMAMAGCLIPFHLLLVLTGAGVVVMYALLCAGAIAGRRNGATSHGPYRMPLYPLAPVLGLAALAYVLYANWTDPDVGRPSLIATAALMAGAFVYCAAMRRRRGPGWVVVGPSDAGADEDSAGAALESEATPV